MGGGEEGEVGSGVRRVSHVSRVAIGTEGWGMRERGWQEGRGLVSVLRCEP